MQEETTKRNEKLVDEMNDLIQLDVDAIHAYDQAIEACESQEVSSKLSELRSDHQRHVENLSECVRTYGGQPKVTRDIKGFLIQGFTAIVSMGDHSALTAMRGNEELTNKTYAAALERELPDDVRQVVQGNYEDERRHLEWIKNAIDTKAWERGPKRVKAA